MVIRTRDRIFFTENLIEVRKEQPTLNGPREVVVSIIPVEGESIQFTGDEAVDVWNQVQEANLIDSVKSLLNG